MTPKTNHGRGVKMQCFQNVFELKHLFAQKRQLQLYFDIYEPYGNYPNPINIHKNKKEKQNTKENLQIPREEINRKRKEQRTVKATKNNLKMAMSIYLSIITLNVNRLNNRKTSEAEWPKSQTHLYAVYKSLTSD